MTESEFNSECQRYEIIAPADFYRKYSKMIMAWHLDEDFFLFLREFITTKSMMAEMGPTVCGVLRYIRQTIKKPGYHKRIWWATIFGKTMAKKMEDKLREYREKNDINRNSGYVGSSNFDRTDNEPS